MDFFGRQEQAKRSTGTLVVLMALAVLGVVVAVTTLAAIVIPNVFFTNSDDPMKRAIIWRSVLQIAGSIAFLIAAASFGKSIALRVNRGAGIATSLGGIPVSSNTVDEGERRLLNVTEEMAIASGVPVPAVYILPNESSINAFAAGFSHDEAVIGVTRGSVEQLSRDELQGVVAHEYSHILHGDMMINVRLMGTLYGLLVISEVGRMVMRSGSRSKEGVPIVIVGVALWIIGLVGYGFGALIRAAISRQREFLADASAVQFTRNPLGLSGALQKIGGADTNRLDAPRASEVSHMLFTAGLSNWLGSMTATHPPLSARIEALIGVKFQDKPRSNYAPSSSLVHQIAPSQVTSMVGTLTADGVKRAEHWLTSLDPTLRQAAYEPIGAVALLVCMVLNPEPSVSATQLQELTAQDSDVGKAAARVAPAVARLGQNDRQPLIDLATTALRKTNESQRAWLLKIVQQLITADGRIDPFEYMIYKILKQRLLGPKSTPINKTQSASGPSAADAATIVLSAICTVAGPDEASRQAAYRAGASRLSGPALTSPTPVVWDFSELEASLARLAGQLPARKKLLLDACAHAVAHDGKIRDDEIYILRAVSEALQCPMPTFMV